MIDKDPTPAPKKKQKRTKKKLIAQVVVVLLVVGLVATSIFFYRQYQNLKSNPEAAAQENVKILTEEVGKLINIPDETPTVAVVEDKESLKDQAFFKDARKGDKVLIFPAAKQAIIYRERDNKLINVGPISLDQQNSQQPAPAQ